MLTLSLPDNNRRHLRPLVARHRGAPGKVPGLSDGKRLFVHGPNVMAGYLLPTIPESSSLAGGWHDTGDIVTMDDGYVAIRGRAKRFAKLGGEMVSLAAVETLACGLMDRRPARRPQLPRPAQGRATAARHRQARRQQGRIARVRAPRGLPRLWVPKEILVVPAVPVLASGKVDLQATVAMARKARPTPDRDLLGDAQNRLSRKRAWPRHNAPMRSQRYSLRQPLTAAPRSYMDGVYKAVRIAGRRGGRQSLSTP